MGIFNYYGMPEGQFGVRSSEFGAGKDSRHRVKDAGGTKDEGRDRMNQLSLTPELRTPNSELNFALVNRHSSLHLALLGDHQIKNAGLALAVVNCCRKNIRSRKRKSGKVSAKVTWPGRMEVLSERPWIVLDGAHNPGAMKTLAENLPKIFFLQETFSGFRHDEG